MRTIDYNKLWSNIGIKNIILDSQSPGEGLFFTGLVGKGVLT